MNLAPLSPNGNTEVTVVASRAKSALGVVLALGGIAYGMAVASAGDARPTPIGQIALPIGGTLIAAVSTMFVPVALGYLLRPFRITLDRTGMKQRWLTGTIVLRWSEIEDLRLLHTKHQSHHVSYHTQRPLGFAAVFNRLLGLPVGSIPHGMFGLRPAELLSLLQAWKQAGEKAGA